MKKRIFGERSFYGKRITFVFCPENIFALDVIETLEKLGIAVKKISTQPRVTIPDVEEGISEIRELLSAEVGARDLGLVEIYADKKSISLFPDIKKSINFEEFVQNLWQKTKPVTSVRELCRELVKDAKNRGITNLMIVKKQRNESVFKKLKAVLCLEEINVLSCESALNSNGGYWQIDNIADDTAIIIDPVFFSKRTKEYRAYILSDSEHIRFACGGESRLLAGDAFLKNVAVEIKLLSVY